MRRFTLILIALVLSSFCAVSAQQMQLNNEQRQAMEKLLPGVTIDDRVVRGLADIYYSRDMPVRVRLKAISKLVGIDQMPPGTALSRKICIWDIAGRNGPVFQAAMDQRAMAREYGINLEMIPSPTKP